MIYDFLKKINDVDQVEADVQKYQQYFSVEEGDVVVDIGAHVGAFSKIALEKASKVIAVEPDPLFYKELSKIESKKFIPIQAGISDADGKSNIVSDGNANALGDKGESVTTFTFKTLVAELPKIDFLKIDCEGAEYDIFTPENIKWLKSNCPKIVGEFHIHNDTHRVQLPYVLHLLEKNGINIVLTNVLGQLISKEELLSKLDYYTEILFYIGVDKVKVPLKIHHHFCNGPFVEILGTGDESYKIKFIDKKNNEIRHETVLKPNHWTKCNFQYYIDWKIQITGPESYHEINLNLNDKRVYISLDSKSLGDTLAWIPYAEEFRKKHNCKVIVSTFKNFLFKGKYPELEFVEPGTIVENIQAQYGIGWYYNEGIIDRFRNPLDPKVYPLQKTACDILGLDYKEIKPLINVEDEEKTNEVTLAIHTTSQAKYWNNPDGWQDVVNFVNNKGHKAVIVSNEGDGWMGNSFPTGSEHLEDRSLENTIKTIKKSKAFVGVGSGLSWLAWACDTPVILVSGFSDPYTEFSCHNVSQDDKEVCSGCFNRFKLDAGDWKWCPIHKGTDREFECSKKINSSKVTNILENYLN